MIRHFSFILMLMAVMWPGQARSQIDEDDIDEGDWEIVLGVDGKYEPKTEGSSVYEFVPKAYFDITYKNRWFLSSDDGLGAYILRDDERELGVGVTRGDDRQEDDDPLLLDGLPEIKKDFAPTVFYAHEFEDIIELGLDVTYDFGGAEGFLIDFSISREFDLSDKVSVEFGSSAVWAESGVLNALYGVTSDQAEERDIARQDDPDLVPLIPIDIGSSVYEVTADITLGYEFSEIWSGGVSADYTRFLGDVKQSVLTRETSEIEGVIFLRRRF